MDETSHISYQINKQDEIIFVNDEWFRFALANDGSNLTREDVLYRSFWDFMSDNKVKYLYREILRWVNAGLSLKFNLRCDSPEIRRLLEMNIMPRKDGEAQFGSRTIRTPLRMPPILFKIEQITKKRKSRKPKTYGFFFFLLSRVYLWTKLTPSCPDEKLHRN